MRILVDTNVFLDFFLKRNIEETRLFFDNCRKKNNPLYITSMSLRDIEYTAHRIFHDKKAAKALQFAAYKICKKVIGISADGAIESLYSDIDDYEDSLQLEAAKEALLDCIVTSNKKDFLKANYPVFTPEEINKYWEINNKN